LNFSTQKGRQNLEEIEEGWRQEYAWQESEGFYVPFGYQGSSQDQKVLI
jgi:hypothetical protein